MTAILDIKTVASQALIHKGSVNVIALDAIRTEIAGRWEKMRDAIHAKLEALLSHKLGPMDFYAQLTDTEYLVITPALDGDDSRLSCLKIAYDLHRSLLGRCSLSDICLSRAFGEAPELRRLESSELAELAVRGGIEELYREAAAGLRSVAPPPPAQEIYDFRYAPVWDAVHEAITGYRLECADPVPREPNAELKRFLAGFAHAARMLSAAQRSGQRFLMIVPMSYEVIGAPAGRMEITAACRGLAAELRPFLIFEITDAPPGVPQSRMTDLVCTFRPFCRAILIELSPDSLDHLACQGAGHQGVGLIIRPSVRIGRDTLERLAVLAKKLGLTSFLRGVAAPELAIQARLAGIQYLSGSLFGESLTVPRSMSRLAWRSVLERNAA